MVPLLDIHWRTIMLLSVLSVALGASGTVPVRAQSPQQNFGELMGTVINGLTQEPLTGANVMLVGTSNGASTDTAGRFTIRRVRTGTYRVRVSLVGFMPIIAADVVVSSAKPAELTFSLFESPVELEGSKVLSDYFAHTPDAPMSTQSLSYQEVQRQPGGLEDAARAVSVMPGIARVEAGRNDLIVRGGSPSENLYLVDGFELPTINHFVTQGVGGGPVSFINIDYVDKVSFTSGGFGVMYGGKLSSVLEIGLKDGRDDRIGGRLTFSATQFGLSVEGPLGKAGSGFVTVRRTYLDWIFKSAGLGFVPEYYDLMGKCRLRLGASDEVSVILFGVLDDINTFNDTEQKRRDNSGILQSSQRQIISGVSLKHLFGRGYLHATIGQAYIDYDNLQVDTGLATTFSGLTREAEVLIKADVVTEVSKGSEISVGAEWGHSGVSNNVYLKSFETTLGDVVPTIRRDDDTSRSRVAFYVQVSKQITPRLRTTLGGRFDYCPLMLTPWAGAPRLSGSYLFAPGVTLSGTIGRFYQLPALLWVIGNPANGVLSYIRLDQYSVGIEELPAEDWKVSLEGYVKRYSNYPASITRPYLVQANTGEGYDYGAADGFASFGYDPMASLGRGRARGLELFVQKKLSGTPYYGLISVSYGEVRFTGLDGVERPGAFDQRVILNVTAGARLNEMWEAGMKFRLATGRPYTPFDANGMQSIAQYYSVRFPPSHSLDLRIDRHWQFPSWNLITYVDVQNVYNRRNRTFIRYNAQTKTFETQERIGILPSIGLIAEL